MQAVISNVVAGLLLVQGLTGWCCHRPSDGRTETSEAPAALKLACCQHCCDQRETVPQPTLPCECSECLGVCTYLPPEKAQIDLQSVASFDLIGAVPAIPDAPTASFGGQAIASDQPEPGLPLRLHLLHQILLV